MTFLRDFSARGQLFGSFGRLFLGDFSARGQFFRTFGRLGRLRLADFKFLGTPNLPAANTGFAKLGQTKLGSTFGILFIFCTFTRQQIFNAPNFAKPKNVVQNPPLRVRLLYNEAAAPPQLHKVQPLRGELRTTAVLRN